MLDSLITQLNSTEPAARRQAIIGLGRTKDLAAIPALARIFSSDPEPELRELARKAAQYIRQQNEAAGGIISTADSELPDRVDMSGAAGEITLRVYETPKPEESTKSSDIPVRGREYVVSFANRQRAKALVESALGANMRGTNAAAMKNLAQALTLDPNLINDPYFGNVAGSVTGVGGDEAVRMILDGKMRTEFVKSEVTKVKEDVRSKQWERAHSSKWGDVGFEAVIYVVINTVFPILFLVVMFELIRQNILPIIQNMSPRELRELFGTDSGSLALLNAGSLPFVPLLVTGLISTVISLLAFVLQMLFVHVSATLLGGNGTLVHLLNKMLMFYNRYVPIGYVVFSIAFAIIIITLDPVSLTPSPLAACGSLFIIGFAGSFVFKMINKIGEAYDFGVAMGCFSILLATVIIAMINVLLAGLFGSAISNLINEALLSAAQL